MTDTLPEKSLHGTAWLYRQGRWEEIAHPAETFGTGADDWFLSYDEKKVETHGIEPIASVLIYHRAPGVETPYPYYVELEIQDRVHFFYIADLPSYLQLQPQLIDQIQKALQLAQFVKQHMKTKSS